MVARLLAVMSPYETGIYVRCVFSIINFCLLSSPTVPYPSQSSKQSSKLEQLQSIPHYISPEQPRIQRAPIPLHSKMQQSSESLSNSVHTNRGTTSAMSPWAINGTIPANSGFALPTTVPVPTQALSTGNNMPIQPPPTGDTIAQPNPEPPIQKHPAWATNEVRSLVRHRDGGLSWARIATHFNGKTPNACRKRYERFRRGIKGAGPISESGNGRGVSLRDGAPIHSGIGTRARIQCLVEEFMDRFIEIIEDIQVPDPVAAVNGTQNVCSLLHIKV